MNYISVIQTVGAIAVLCLLMWGQICVKRLFRREMYRK